MSLPPFSTLKVSQEGRLVFVELDHGKANEMGRAAVADFERLAEAIPQTDAAALITLSRRKSSKGTPIFVAGADVTERSGWTQDEVRQHVRWQRQTLLKVRAMPVFHIACVDGVALGWGTEYLLACDYRIGCDRAEFGLPETGLGILPGAGGTADLWAHVGVAHALRLGMTGERIGPDEALRIGLLQERAADVEAALARARALAGLAAKRSPTAMAAFKAGVLEAVGAPADRRVEIEARAYERCVDSGEAAIGRAFFEASRRGEAIPWGPRVLSGR